MADQPSAEIIDLHAPRKRSGATSSKTAPVRRDLGAGIEAKDQDTIRTLSLLLSEAVAGQLIGVAVVCRYRESHFSTVIAGEAYRSPNFTRGALASLDDILSELICKTRN